MAHNTIILLGLAGSGKSTLGSELASKMSLPFIDLDQAIEEKTALTIQQIFEDQGEPYFRKIESETLHEVLTLNSDIVLATGGGTPCYFDNMELMNNSGKTIFLDVPIDKIAERLANSDLETRPLFKGLLKAQLLQKLNKQLEIRKQYFQKAKYTFSGEVSADEIIFELTSSA
ncbi:MAG: shikimate kinase [Cyclobacteriaceae bacterium]|nr:shikimate kinase [Cyclobacteriaceae bacterium]